MNKIDFIAEVSSNHNQDLIRMKEFIYASSEAGCTGIKFQLFKIDQLFSKEILKNSQSTRDRKKWELPAEYIPELASLSKKLNLQFSCTPFHIEAVKYLQPFVDFYKIASYELLWLDLFKICALTQLPLVFSTGMAVMEEIKDAVDTIIKNNCKDITILHCNSAYPTPVEDANLKVIHTLRSEFRKYNTSEDIHINIGYSDHTANSAVIYRAVHNYNVKFIEFHLDLDGKGNEYQNSHCWLPKDISEVINNVSTSIKADGEGKIEPSPSEINDRQWRTDPSDGLRPMKSIRGTFIG